MRNGAMIAAVVAGVACIAPSLANAICPHTSVKGMDGQCLGMNCPPSETAYMATIENRFSEKLYISYAFRRPDGSLLTAGLALKPGVTRLPLGFGRTPFTEDEAYDARLGRMRIVICDTDPDTMFKWRNQ